MLRFGLIVAAAIVLLDQASKYLVLNLLGFSPPGCREFSVDCGFIEVSPIFDLSMVWNRGVSFGMLRADSEAARWALVALQFAISGLFGWWLLSARNRLVAWGFALVIGGALGNVIDRIRYGAVVDFLDFRGLGFPWVFNIADAAINVGAGLLILDLLLQARAKREAPPPTAS
jgi:signal peptidase II